MTLQQYHCSYCSLIWIHRDGLGEAYDRDISFANSLETFSGGHNDPISVAFGGIRVLIILSKSFPWEWAEC